MIECLKCELAAKKLPVGFTGEVTYICTKFDGMPVTAEDGCTFGTEGVPQPCGSLWDVTVSGHEAVYGYSQEGWTTAWP